MGTRPGERVGGAVRGTETLEDVLWKRKRNREGVESGCGCNKQVGSDGSQLGKTGDVTEKEQLEEEREEERWRYDVQRQEEKRNR